MNPREFRDLASDLVASADSSSAELRTAVSRAYYAAFHVAVQMMRKMGIKEPARWDAHTLVPEALRYSSDAEIGTAARDLSLIRKARWAADYDMEDDETEDQRTVRKLVARAKQVVKKLDECEANATRFMEARIKVRNWAGSAEGTEKGFTLI